MDELRLKNFYQKFPTEEACLEYLEKMRWPETRACPHCGSVKTYKFKNGKLFKCGDCRKQFTAKVGTIFTDSHIKLQDWFLAIYLLTSLKKGISSIRMAEYLGVTQKTAWFMLQRIRYAMDYGTIDKPLGGVTEADETYIIGTKAAKGRHVAKVAVMGIVERKKGSGRIVTKVTRVPDATVAMPFIRAYLKQNAILNTDESRIYNRVKREYHHEFVTHAKREYARGDVTTNTVEGAWAHLKLGLKAIYLGVSAKHLAMYCAEFGYRYNTRDITSAERFEKWFERIDSKHLTYKALIG